MLTSVSKFLHFFRKMGFCCSWRFKVFNKLMLTSNLLDLENAGFGLHVEVFLTDDLQLFTSHEFNATRRQEDTDPMITYDDLFGFIVVAEVGNYVWTYTSINGNNWISSN